MSIRAYLEQVRQRAENATEGEWLALNDRPHGDRRRGVYIGNIESETWQWIATVHYARDLDLLAHARTDVPRLVAMLTKAVEALQAVDGLKYSSSMKHISEQATKIAAEALATLDALAQETP